MQATAKVTRAGQISIPVEIRQAMEIEEGDLVTVDVLAVAKKAKDLKEQGKGEALIPALA
jgi:AbrB family looped-hinge helix DNA binding protein